VLRKYEITRGTALPEPSPVSECIAVGYTAKGYAVFSDVVVIDRGEVRKRKKKPSKKFRDTFGHTPISPKEAIPWKCRQLVIGTGTGALPVMDEVKQEATPQDPPDQEGHPGTEARTRNQRNPARDLLTDTPKRSTRSHSRTNHGRQ